MNKKTKNHSRVFERRRVHSTKLILNDKRFNFIWWHENDKNHYDNAVKSRAIVERNISHNLPSVMISKRVCVLTTKSRNRIKKRFSMALDRFNQNHLEIACGLRKCSHRFPPTGWCSQIFIFNGYYSMSVY